MGGGWLTLTNSPLCDTGNAMDEASIVFLNKTVEIRALRAYRRAIGRRKRQIANQLRPADLLRKVEPARINQVMKEGAVVEAARSIVDYWSRRDVAGLLLMPATRHNLIHLGEALRLKRKGS
jgi:hypothetical protein